ncbi:hypothetical protein PF008_g29332 [Phytophthora fragariae]|uniref:DDE Tnp4 domain-containing protein n=1 Tax=Phytophthora fragariae TaxID=53985 RepID=A0A6G0Q8Q3_9STRA|nr:hypothetical protein PF008_g29332 [Phytophthora fragariae]
MAPSRNRVRRTQQELDNEARERWDRLFVEEEARQRDLARVELPTSRDYSDDECSSPSPVYDRCLRVQGPERVLKMRNFAPVEFERIWDAVEDHVMKHWNVGRGKKSVNAPKDILFMTLAALKHCGSWETASTMFEMDLSPFQKMVKKFVTMLDPCLYQIFVLDEEERSTTRHLTLTGNTFANFPCARYATDVTFQQADRPVGGYNDAKTFFSGKHHLYGLKVEVSVIPTGVAINCTDWEKGSIADISIFRANKQFHTSAMQKRPGEDTINDQGPQADRYQNDWAVLVDKGYQGLQDEFRTIQPKKRAARGPPLTADERSESDRISHDRVLVESYFGRLKKLWGVCSHKWVWDRQTYNMFFRMCVALTNFSVRCCPLRREDGEHYLRYEARLIKLDLDIEEAKRLKRQRARDSRRARLELHTRAAIRPANTSSRRSSVGSRTRSDSDVSTDFGS